MQAPKTYIRALCRLLGPSGQLYPQNNGGMIRYMWRLPNLSYGMHHGKLRVVCLLVGAAIV